jgi:hypothetical protein
VFEGACDCDGNVEVGCGCGQAGPSGCDNTCGSTLENDECGVCGGSGIPDGQCDCDGNVDDACGICGGDNSCFTFPEDLIGPWEGSLYTYDNSTCSGDEPDPHQSVFTFNDDGTILHEYMDRMNGDYLCSEYPDCDILEEEGIWGTCSDDVYCQRKVSETIIWGINNNNQVCFLFNQGNPPTQEYYCGEYNVSDESVSITFEMGESCDRLDLNTLKYIYKVEGMSQVCDPA